MAKDEDDAKAKAEADAKAKADDGAKLSAAALDELAKEFTIDPTVYTDFDAPTLKKSIAEHWKDHPTNLGDGEYPHAKTNAVYTVKGGRLVKVVALDANKGKTAAANPAKAA